MLLGLFPISNQIMSLFILCCFSFGKSAETPEEGMDVTPLMRVGVNDSCMFRLATSFFPCTIFLPTGT